MKSIDLNKFYLIHDGSKIGHPGLCVWSDQDSNLYLLIKFGSSKTDDNIKLKHSISSNKLNSFVYKRPFVGKRKDIGNEMQYDIKISKEDEWILIEIPRNNPIFSKTLKSKDKHRFKYRYKKTVS